MKKNNREKNGVGGRFQLLVWLKVGSMATMGRSDMDISLM